MRPHVTSLSVERLQVLAWWWEGGLGRHPEPPVLVCRLLRMVAPFLVPWGAPSAVYTAQCQPPGRQALLRGRGVPTESSWGAAHLVLALIVLLPPLRLPGGSSHRGQRTPL